MNVYRFARKLFEWITPDKSMNNRDKKVIRQSFKLITLSIVRPLFVLVLIGFGIIYGVGISPDYGYFVSWIANMLIITHALSIQIFMYLSYSFGNKIYYNWCTCFKCYHFCVRNFILGNNAVITDAAFDYTNLSFTSSLNNQNSDDISSHHSASNNQSGGLMSLNPEFGIN